MYNIAIMTMGENRVTKDVLVGGYSILTAEARAIEEVRQILGYPDFTINCNAGGFYEVYHFDTFVGYYVITKL